MTLYAGFIMAIDAQVSDAVHWPLVLLCYVVDPNAMSWKLDKTIFLFLLLCNQLVKQRPHNKL